MTKVYKASIKNKLLRCKTKTEEFMQSYPIIVYSVAIS